MTEDIKELIGQVFDSVTREGDEALIFQNQEKKVVFRHEQDCCESVTIEDVTGDLADLQGAPITIATLSAKDDDDDDGWISRTWSFYNFSTVKGSVNVRWLGESNGYYSESVNMEVVALK